jgi:hypothetical protein
VDKIKGGIPNKQGRPFHSGNKKAKRGYPYKCGDLATPRI